MPHWKDEYMLPFDESTIEHLRAQARGRLDALKKSLDEGKPTTIPFMSDIHESRLIATLEKAWAEIVLLNDALDEADEEIQTGRVSRGRIDE